MILKAQFPSAQPRRVAIALRRALEIDHHQASPGFEHARNLSESLPFEVIGQVVHHQGAQYDIERLVGERELLDHPDPRGRSRRPG